MITSRYYRKTFDENNLPNVYVGMYQFNKSKETQSFFKLLDIVMQNWEIFYKTYAPNKLQEWCSVDVSVAITLKILDMQGYSLNHSPMEFTHMKPYAQNIANPQSKWTDILSVDFSKEIYINGYKQSGVLHYVEDEFLTDDALDWLKERV